MSGISIDVKIDDRKVLALIGRTMARARDLRPAQKSIGEYMQREREKWFAEERDPEGKPWQPLKVRTYYSGHRGKKYTKKGKLTRGFQAFLLRKKILTKDHHLRRTVYRLGTGIVTVSPDKTSSDYARIHQLGGKAGRGHKSVIPARPHLGVTDAHRREFVEIIKEHLL